MSKSTSTFSFKFLRNSVIVLIVLALFLYIALFFFSKSDTAQTNSEAQSLEEEIAPQISDQYPKETAFVEEYFSLIQQQDYQALLKTYWDPSVVAEIRQNCSSPLGEDPSTTTETLWRNCEHLENISIEIISVEQNETSSSVTVQFFDESGDIVGLELHPEWVRGHQLRLEKSEFGFRTSNWDFL